ncbi:hypothetical protein GCM10020000_70470 [Streptomyces olivoverticillatus]
MGGDAERCELLVDEEGDVLGGELPARLTAEFIGDVRHDRLGAGPVASRPGAVQSLDDLVEQGGQPDQLPVGAADQLGRLAVAGVLELADQLGAGHKRGLPAPVCRDHALHRRRTGLSGARGGWHGHGSSPGGGGRTALRKGGDGPEPSAHPRACATSG